MIQRQLLVQDYESEQFYLKKGLKSKNFEQLIGTLASHFIATHYGGLAMNPIDFIYTNIQKQLITEGFAVGIANLAARYGFDEYKNALNLQCVEIFMLTVCMKHVYRLKHIKKPLISG